MNSKGQTILEYIVLIGVVTMVLVYMGTDMKRGLQSAIKVTADQMGNQANADQDFNQESQQGIMTNSSTSAWQRHEQATGERIGIITPQQADFTETTTKTYTNVGKSTR